MDNIGLADNIIAALKQYAKGRSNDVANGLESAELSALLVEKYAIGVVDAVRVLKPMLGLNIDLDSIVTEADILCRSIDPKTEENRMLRYKRVAKLDLSEERVTK